tara:strand:+ start:247 stop:459 length:213 start_codon:yes stop_codon:yes gene_type:complete
MKGKISKSVEGTFKKVIKKGKYASELDSVKNVISSNKVKINVKEKKIRVSKRIFLKNNFIKYLSNVFIMN